MIEASDDGTGQTNLSNDTIFFDGRPDWQPIPLGTNGPLAFTSTRDGDGEIYKMNPDGSGQTRLTNNPASEGFGRWSPDGTQLVFESDRDGDFEVFKMNADGSGVVQLTFNTASDGTPAWSNDGSKVVFRSNRDGGDFEIYSMNALAPGRVLPDITVDRVTSEQIRIRWSGSDCAGGEDYGIYEGTIGDSVVCEAVQQLGCL